MSEKHYLPRPVAKLVPWLRNFATQLDRHGPTLGLAADDIAAGKADSLYVAAVLELQQQATQFGVAWTSHKRQVLYGEGATNWPVTFAMPATLPTPTPGGAMRRITRVVGRIKTSPAYQPNIGIAFDIIGTDRRLGPAELAQIQPVLKVLIGPGGHPIVRWRKRGLGGIEIHVDRGDGKGFVYLTMDIQPDYIDRAPLPPPGTVAIWTYRAIYLKRDIKVGQWSNPTAITITGGM